MSETTGSRSSPRTSTAPASIAQTMNASSGSAEWPIRIDTAGRYPPYRAQRVDPGLPEGGLQAAGGERAGDDRRAREGPGRRSRVGVGDGEEARRARVVDARAVSRRTPHRSGRARRARGDPPPSPARAISREDARRARRRRPRRGGPARARHLRGARSAHRPRARIPDARPARRPDPGCEPRMAYSLSVPPSAPEEKPLERGEQLVAVERLDLRVAAVVLRHHRVVLERLVRRLEAVVELVTLPHVVV